ncbi:MAG: hypothetical protein ACFFED_01500 [Candidatus Thorarchaeota archaeon]
MDQIYYCTNTALHMQKKNGPPELMMNVSRDQPENHHPRTACGRIGCVTIYKTDDCHLCEAVDSYLKDLVRSEGLSENIINTIDRASMKEEPNFDGVYSAPAVRVCQTVMTGLPDDDKMRSSLRSATNKKCFLEDVT